MQVAFLYRAVEAIMRWEHDLGFFSRGTDRWREGILSENGVYKRLYRITRIKCIFLREKELLGFHPLGGDLRLGK